MKIDSKLLKYLKECPNSAYDSLKIEFFYNSNKLEGSTFSKENLELYLNNQIIEGTHKVDDIYETINSTRLFDFLVDTLDEPLTKSLILESHRMLKNHTLDHERGFAGCFKKIPNKISGTDLVLAQPFEVDMKIEQLLLNWNNCHHTFEDIVNFHVQFELIHPFQDGNGRIGRFIMLRQCLEHNIDLILIDDMYAKEYKEALYKAQSLHDNVMLLDIFKKCQKLLNKKLKFVLDTVTYIRENHIEYNY